MNEKEKRVIKTLSNLLNPTSYTWASLLFLSWEKFDKGFKLVKNWEEVLTNCFPIPKTKLKLSFKKNVILLFAELLYFISKFHNCYYFSDGKDKVKSVKASEEKIKELHKLFILRTLKGNVTDEFIMNYISSLLSQKNIYFIKPKSNFKDICKIANNDCFIVVNYTSFIRKGETALLFDLVKDKIYKGKNELKRLERVLEEGSKMIFVTDDKIVKKYFKIRRRKFFCLPCHCLKLVREKIKRFRN